MKNKYKSLFATALILAIFLTFLLIPSPSSVQANTPSDGNFTNLIVFAKFKDETEFIDDTFNTSSTVKSIVENSYARAEYNVTDYYEKVSNGKVKMQNVYLLDKNGESVTLSRERGYYCSKDESNPIGYTDSEYYTRMFDLKSDWANAISTTVSNGGKITDFNQNKQYDLTDLDKNGDGYVDCLTIVYKYSERYSVSWRDCLWNYQDFYSGAIFQDGSTTIQSGTYLQFSANFNYTYSDSNGVRFASLKTMIHETGHIFGLKDLYRNGSESRVYYMSAMANALSPIPQYISAKEREALGWFEKDNVKYIESQGTYTINLTTDSASNGVICYKLNLADSQKTVYFEYRRFDGTANKYDSQSKIVYNANGDLVKAPCLKSGLVCFLADKNTKFPNNLNTYGSKWNYEVLGGSYSTKSDAALGENDSLLLSTRLEVKVISVDDETLTFSIIGDGIDAPHTHSVSKVKYAAPTCFDCGNIEYYHCLECGSYFADEQLTKSITLKETVLQPKHNKVKIDGYAPTCKKKGLTDGEKCSNCDEIFLEQREIDELPHVSSDWIIDEDATEHKNGQKHKECIECKEILETESIEYEKPPEKGDDTIPPSDGNGDTQPPSGEDSSETPPSGDLDGTKPPNEGNDSDDSLLPDDKNDSSDGKDDANSPPSENKPDDGYSPPNNGDLDNTPPSDDDLDDGAPPTDSNTGNETSPSYGANAETLFGCKSTFNAEETIIFFSLIITICLVIKKHDKDLED